MELYRIVKRLIVLHTLPVLLFYLFSVTGGWAQQRTGTEEYRIVAVMTADYPEYREAYEGFIEELRTRGIGYTVELIESIGNNDIDENFVRRVRENNTDLILAIGTRAADSISKRISDIPIVFAMVMNPHFDTSDDLSYRNVTGVRFSIPVETQFQVYKEIIPGLTNIGVIYTPEENEDVVSEAEQAARNLDLNLVKGNVNSEREVPQTVQNFIRVVDIIWKIVDSAVSGRETTEHIVLEGFRNNIPIVGLGENIVRAGAALAVSADFRMVGMQSGVLAEKILQGTSPAALEIEYPREYILYVNARIANGIGLRIPDSLEQRIRVIYR
ncbi:ABC transporter substrate-binding protein [candidate division KSB1 bacterium]